MTATLQTLDVYPMYTQTATRLARVRELLADPLEYATPSDDPDSLVEGQVVPEDVRKSRYFLAFHADKESDTTDERRLLITVHLRYRRRPSGPIPRVLTSLKERGFTAEWVEGTLLKIGSPIMFVDATLALPSEDRKPLLVPPILVGDAALKRCGEEYRTESAVVGELSRYRWLEEGGKVRVWLGYSYIASKRPTEGLWIREEQRCREYLQQLV